MLNPTHLSKRERHREWWHGYGQLSALYYVSWSLSIYPSLHGEPLTMSWIIFLSLPAITKNLGLSLPQTATQSLHIIHLRTAVLWRKYRSDHNSWYHFHQFQWTGLRSWGLRFYYRHALFSFIHAVICCFIYATFLLPFLPYSTFISNRPSDSLFFFWFLSKLDPVYISFLRRSWPYMHGISFPRSPHLALHSFSLAFP